MSGGGGAKFPDVGVVCVDTETSGLHWDDGARVSTVVIGWDVGDDEREIRMLPFDQGRLEEKMPLRARELDLWQRGEESDGNLDWEHWVDLLDWLAGRELLIMHNAKFDLHMLRVGTREWEGIDLVAKGVRTWCTQVAAKEIEPLEQVGLDAIGKRLGLGEKQGADKLKSWLVARKLDKGRYDLVPIEIMEQYAEGDVDLTLSVWDWQKRRMARDEGMLAQIARKQNLMKVLYKMEKRGIPYQAAKSEEIANQLEAEIRKLEKARPFGGGLSDARKWFFDTHGGEYLRVTEKGTKSLDEETTRSLGRQGIPWAKEYAELQILKTSVSMWYRGYADKIGSDGRLRCTYRQTKVVSNRMSVERVQLQAIPKQNKLVVAKLGEGTSVRSLIRNEEGGTKLWNLDLAQAELRVAAKYAKCQKMLQMLERGEDFHSYTTERVLGVTKDDPEWKMKRDTGKRLSFSSIFQIGGKELQANLAKVADIVVTEDEATQMVWKWRAEYPEFTIAYNRAEKLAEKQQWVPLLAKTKYASRSWYSEWEPKNTGWSRMVQGSLAEALALWLVEAERSFPGVMILTVHDSIVVETDDEEIVKGIVKKGEELLSELFKIEMKVDSGLWSY